jgi:hypothetical protein
VAVDVGAAPLREELGQGEDRPQRVPCLVRQVPGVELRRSQVQPGEVSGVDDLVLGASRHALHVGGIPLPPLGAAGLGVVVGHRRHGRQDQQGEQQRQQQSTHDGPQVAVKQDP